MTDPAFSILRVNLRQQFYFRVGLDPDLGPCVGRAESNGRQADFFTFGD